jgi:long-chain acyl-CoA synthetase
MGSGISQEDFDYDAQLMSAEGKYTVETDEKFPDSTNPRRCPDAIDGLIPSSMEGVTTVWEGFTRAADEFQDSIMLGCREFVLDEKDDSKYERVGRSPVRGPFRWLSYNDVRDRVEALGSGLVDLGLQAEDNVGIFSLNRVEWVMTSLAAYSQTMRATALYSTLGDDAIEYIINHAELKVLFLSKEQIPELLKVIDRLPTLEYVVQFDSNPDFGNVEDTIDESDVEAFSAAGKQLIGFTSVLERGRNAGNPVQPPTREDLAFIMYTSGTTGNPKGVMLAHKTLVASGTPGVPGFTMGPDDRYLSYLPLAHIFESCVQLYLWMVGCPIGFFQGDVKKLTEDFQTLEPTLVCGVPRVFQRIYQKVFDKVNSANCIRGFVFNKAYSEQCAAVREGRRVDSWDEKVFSKVAENVGFSRLRAVCSGGAPCPPYLAEFLKVCFNCAVVQGYGLTETAAALTLQRTDDVCVGHVGAPLPWAEIRLVSVPEMEYLASDNPPTGEVWVRGDGVFVGYYKNEEATEGAFEDGWFKTGDVGRWNPNGTLSIIDRKKNIFKLAQGEYVASEKVENVYAQSAVVGQLWIYGNSYKSQLVAVLVPNAEWVLRYATSQGWSSGENAVGSEEFIAEFQALFENHGAQLRDVIRENLSQVEGSLKGFEKIKNFHIETEIDTNLQGFNVENECMTPTFKLRRPFLKKRYLDILKDMYTELGEPPKDEERW